VRESHRYMLNTAAEGSGGMQSGLLPAAVERQRKWTSAFNALVNAVYAPPFGDKPKTHDMPYRVDCSEMPTYLLQEGKVVNPHIQILTEKWHAVWYELVRSDSAGLPSSLHDFDYERCMDLIDSLLQILDAVELHQPTDLPETANPEARQYSGGTGTREPAGGQRTTNRATRATR